MISRAIIVLLLLASPLVAAETCETIQWLDADTGKVVSKSGRAFTFPAQAQQTYWFLFK